jgi:glycosyltransferase involved in cell wall biosynthesis
MKVLIQQPRLPHYRVPLFEKLVQLHGWDITLAYTPCAGSGESGLEVTAGNFLFRSLHLSLRRYAIGRLRLNIQRGLLDCLRAGRWDAVFLEGAQSNFSGFLAARWCRRHRIPCIWWTKGYFVPQNALRRLLHRIQLREPHAFLPYGDSTHAFLTQYGVLPEQIVRAYNTVDVEALVNRRVHLTKVGLEMLSASFGERIARPIITYVGRLITSKRVDDLLKGVRDLCQQGVPCSVWIIGDGPERVRLEQLATHLDIQQYTAFVGRVPVDGDSAALSVSDVSVFPGVHGLAINQAMALGVPVIISDLPGPDGEMVIHQRTGWRFLQGEIAALVQTIQEALASPQRARIVQDAQEEILGRRTLQHYAKAFYEAVQCAQSFC